METTTLTDDEGRTFTLRTAEPGRWSVERIPAGMPVAVIHAPRGWVVIADAVGPGRTPIEAAAGAFTEPPDPVWWRAVARYVTAESPAGR